MITVTVEVDTPEEAAFVAGCLTFRKKMRQALNTSLGKINAIFERNTITSLPSGERRLLELNQETLNAFRISYDVLDGKR